MKADPYSVTYKGLLIDPYRILHQYGITHPAQQHAIKKLLRAGKSHKQLRKDIEETIQTLNRWIEMMEQDMPKGIQSLKTPPSPLSARKKGNSVEG